MQAGIAPAGVIGTMELFEPDFTEVPLTEEIIGGAVGVVWLLVADVFGAEPLEFQF